MLRWLSLRISRCVGEFAFEVFGAEKAPYMLTIFIAAAAWTVVRTTDRLAGLPLVEYRILNDSSDESHRLAIRLRNITSAISFRCFGLTVASATDSSLKIDTSKPHTVRLRGGVLAKIARESFAADVARFKIENFAPGADADIHLTVVGADAPRLLVSGCDGGLRAGAVDSKVPDHEPILIERSLKSTLVEFEILILWAGLAIWLVLLVFMFSASRRTVPVWKD